MSRSLIAFPRARDTPPSTPPLWARRLEQSAWEFTPGGKRRLITSELRAQGTSSGLRAALKVNGKSDKTATVKQKPSKDTQYYPPKHAWRWGRDYRAQGWAAGNHRSCTNTYASRVRTGEASPRGE